MASRRNEDELDIKCNPDRGSNAVAYGVYPASARLGVLH